MLEFCYLSRPARAKKWGYLMSKIIVALAAIGLMTSAAHAGSSGSPLKGRTIHKPVMTLKTKNEAYVTGNGESASLTQFAFTPIDSGTTLNCKKACTLSAEATSQMNTGGADWAICIVIDGADVECQYQGVQSGPSGFVVGNASGSTTGGIGAHTFQTQLYTESASATYQFFNMHYAVHS